MGLRIHKVLGWAIELIDMDVSLPDLILQDIIDSNANNQKLKLELPFLKGSKTNLGDKISKFIRKIEINGSTSKRVFLVIIHPAMLSEWERIDNSIDYYENKGLTDSVLWLSNEIFPFYEDMIISSTLKKLDKFERKMISYAHTLEKTSSNYQKLSSKGLNLNYPIADQLHMECPILINLIFKELMTENPLSLKPAIFTYFE